MKTKLLLSIVIFAWFASFAASAQVPIRKGWWKFDDPANLDKAELGVPLVLTGSQTSVPGPQVGNLATQVPLGSYLTMNHGLAPSLGGTKVNEYSLQIDFSVPVAEWHSFFQTDLANASDAELFIKPANIIGVGGPGYSVNTISQDTWYRMVVSVKNGTGGFFKIYIDGVLWLDAPAQAIDDRWALDNALLMFADNDGDDGTINCSELGLWDVALTDAQALELGNATPVPVRLGWWKFDDAADMLKAEIGTPLVLSGSQTSVPGPADGNLATQVPKGSYLSMAHGIAANGGGTMVNEYSVQIDFSVPAIGVWHSFIQTEPTNTGGGSVGDADLFTNTSNKIGTSTTGYSTNTISADRWYRMIISVKNGQFFRVYIDGELWLENTLQTVDGRWALQSVLLIFADDDGDDADINCSELAIWDVALSAFQASELGKAANNILVSQITVTSAGNATSIDTQGGTLQMSAAVLPANATKPDVVWSLANATDKATIDANGLLTAIKNGTVTVNATSTDGGNVVGSMDITISNQPVILVSGITVTSAGDATVINTKGGTLQMSAAVLPVDATDLTYTWSVSNSKATISADGLLTAVTDGTVTVKATANDGSNVFGSKDITISNQSNVRERKGWWKFDDPADLLKPEIGSPLTLDGTQTSVAGPLGANLATEVPLGSFLNMTHGIPANGGGALVNEWSVQIDFSVAQLDTWYAFFQTGDASGDADLFVAATAAPDISRVPNAIGCGSTLYTPNTISANTWYRMIVSVKNGDGGFFKIYVDGVLWLDAAAQPIDGRYGLGPILMLFQDNDGDDGLIDCSEAGIWDVALTAAEALELGKATNSTTGIRNLQITRNSDLGQNFPNPFSTQTTFPYQIKETGNVTFRILDLTGKEVEVINQGIKAAGNYQLELQSEKLNNGVYYLQMTTNQTVSTRKMVVFK